MQISLRSHTLSQPLSRVCCAILSALMLLAPAAEAAPARSKSRTSKSGASKSGAKTPPAAPAPQPEPSKPEPAAAAPVAAPVAESKPAAEPARAAPEPKPVAESKPAAQSKPTAPRAAPLARAAPAPTPAPAAGPGRMRIGVGGDLFLENARMTGVQGINASRIDESFAYNSLGFVSVTAWLNTSVPTVSERLRVGAGLRVFGNYAAGGGEPFGFGLLNEAFVNGEYGLPVADKMEVVFGGRAGLSFLVPTEGQGTNLAGEIRRLQEQGVAVWSVPRVGWLLGPSVGARRRMSDRIWLRADLNGQIGQQYLFATSQEISGLRYTKNWSTLALRLGLNLGAEFAL
ncbi:hypothetical protein [Archangium sp.]|uniref:hypothetical protein n=1 Tax=Archangium sp. TaxID=1872627 RepID=UPI00286BB3E3|nr:hypothetical protein [Archangium sp.]